MPTFTSFLPVKLLQAAYGGLRGPLLAALLALIVGIPCALMLPPMDRDESRFAQASSQMLESHDYININLQNVPRHKKPVGIYWLQALCVKMTTGVAARDIFPYRLPSLIGAALAAFACAWGAAKAFGTRVGTKAGLLFAVAFVLAWEASSARTDALLCGTTTLMMAALARLYLGTRALDPEAPNPDTKRPKFLKEKLIFWLSMAATILLKGPIGPMVLATTLLALWVWDVLVLKNKTQWIRHLGWGWGLCLLALICGPWAVAITITTDGAFWTHAIGGDLASKVDGGSEGHSGLPGYHTVLLALTLFPASWLLGGAIQTAVFRRHEAAIRFALCWFLPAFLVFELTPTKLPHYPLPTFAALIWLCAVSLDVPLKGWARGINWTLGLLGGILFTAVAVVGFQKFGPPHAIVFVVLTGISAVGIAAFAAWLLWRQHPRYGFGFLLAAGFLTHLCIVSLAVSLKPIWVSNAMRQALVSAHLDPRQGIAPGPVAVLGYNEPSFVFAEGTKTQLLDTNANGAVDALQDGRPLFVEQRDQAAFLNAAANAGLTPHAVSQVKGFDYSNGKPVVLTLYDNPPPVDPTAPTTAIAGQ